jgi:hypothetical protein
LNIAFVEVLFLMFIDRYRERTFAANSAALP